MNEVLTAVGLKYKGTLRIRHMLDPLINDIGLEAIAAKVQKPLKGLKVAPYYGCQIVRPFTELDDPHQPEMMDRLLEVLGATVAPFEYKTRCCGGAQMGTNQDLALRFVFNLLKCAFEGDSDVICTTCPLCQMNLEAYQGTIRRRYKVNFSLPVVYFTQLTAAAMGLPDEIVMPEKHFEPVVEKLSAAKA